MIGCDCQVDPGGSADDRSANTEGNFSFHRDSVRNRRGLEVVGQNMHARTKIENTHKTNCIYC